MMDAAFTPSDKLTQQGLLTAASPADGVLPRSELAKRCPAADNNGFVLLDPLRPLPGVVPPGVTASENLHPR